MLSCKLAIYLFTCCSVRRPLRECIHTGPIFFNLFWFWRSKITRLDWLKPILLLTVEISCEIFYLTEHTYKCNNIFCSNKVWIAVTSNLFWTSLSFFGLFLQVMLQRTQINGGKKCKRWHWKPKWSHFFKLHYWICRKTLLTFELQFSN